MLHCYLSLSLSLFLSPYPYILVETRYHTMHEVFVFICVVRCEVSVVQK